jgi:hypothetical protein
LRLLWVLYWWRTWYYWGGCPGSATSLAMYFCTHEHELSVEEVRYHLEPCHSLLHHTSRKLAIVEYFFVAHQITMRHYTKFYGTPRHVHH